MKHGQNCDCMRCTIGKNLGRIKKNKEKHICGPNCEIYHKH